MDPQSYLAELAQGRSVAPATLRALRQDLQALAKLAAGRDPATLDSRAIRSLVAAEHRRGLAPASLRRMLSSWRRYYAHLAALGKVGANPATDVRPPRSARKLTKTLSPEEAYRLLTQAASDELATRDLAMLETAYSSALRVSELVALDLGDIDRDAQTVNVRHGKGDRQRIVPLGAKALAAIDRWLLKRVAGQGQDANALFTSKAGRRLSVRSVQLRIKKLALKAGLPGNITPHVLRHSCASHMLQSSGDLRGVQEILGHADIASTQIYTHLDFQALAKVYDKTHPRAKGES